MRWLDRERLQLSIALNQVSPQLDLCSDASDVGWGVHLRGRGYFWPLVSRRVGSVDQHQRALGYRKSSSLLRSANQGRVSSHFCGKFHRDCLPSETGGHKIPVVECHRSADSSVVRASSSASGSTVHQEPSRVHRFSFASESSVRFGMDPQDRGLQELQSRWPVSIDLVASSLNHHCCPYFSPFRDLNALGTDALLQSWNGWQAYAFPPWSLTGSAQEAPVVLLSLFDNHSSILASMSLVSGPPGFGCRRSGGSASVERSLAPATLPSSSSGNVRAVASCLETIQRFAGARGFSKHVAKQSALARRASSRAGYQAKWSIHRQWCHVEGHSVSRPSLSKIADFLFWLRRSKKLSISAVFGYRSMLSAVFRTVLPDIATSLVIQDLLRSFKVEAPCKSVKPPSWDLLKVLEYLRSPVFEPLSNASLCDLTRKTLFLVALAWPNSGNFKHFLVSSLFPLLRRFWHMYPSLWPKQILQCVPFHAHFPSSLLRISYCVRSALCKNMLRGLRDLSIVLGVYLCLLTVFHVQCQRMGSLFFLHEVTVHSGASSEVVAAPRAHSIRGIATSSAFKNWSLSSVLEAASWRSNSVFTSFHFRDLQYVFEGVYSLGPFVASGERIR